MTMIHGRRSVRPDHALAVFVIGLRIHRWSRPDGWWDRALARELPA